MKKTLATLATLAALAANAAVNPSTTPEMEIEAQRIVVAALEEAVETLEAEAKAQLEPNDFYQTTPEGEARIAKHHRKMVLADEVGHQLELAQKKLKKLEKKHGKAAPKPAKADRAAGNAEKAKQL